VHETVSIKLPRDFLKSKRANGFTAKLWDRRDSVVISVPPEYIEGLLARMENRAPVAPGERMPADSASVPAAPAPLPGLFVNALVDVLSKRSEGHDPQHRTKGLRRSGF